MERIERGWRLGVLSMQVVAADASLAVLVVLGAVAGVAGATALFVPAYLAYDIDADWLAAIFAALGVFVTTTTSVVFGVALAAASADVLDGKDATVRWALAVVWARLGVIMGWASCSSPSTSSCSSCAAREASSGRPSPASARWRGRSRRSSSCRSSRSRG